MSNQITIRGREYQVSNEQGRYVLSGKRGTKYGALQNTSGQYFLIDMHKIGLTLKGVLLANVNGHLQVVCQ
jgi:hypothetical protein